MGKVFEVAPPTKSIDAIHEPKTDIVQPIDYSDTFALFSLALAAFAMMKTWTTLVWLPLFITLVLLINMPRPKILFLNHTMFCFLFDVFAVVFTYVRRMGGFY